MANAHIYMSLLFQSDYLLQFNPLPQFQKKIFKLFSFLKNILPGFILSLKYLIS